MVTIYDMASGVIRRASAEADDTSRVSIDHIQDTEQADPTPHKEKQLALREQAYPEITQDNANTIPAELASINTDKFISNMEK